MALGKGSLPRAGLADSRQRMFVGKKLAYFFAESLSLSVPLGKGYFQKKNILFIPTRLLARPTLTHAPNPLPAHTRPTRRRPRPAADQIHRRWTLCAAATHQIRRQRPTPPPPPPLPGPRPRPSPRVVQSRQQWLQWLRGLPQQRRQGRADFVGRGSSSSPTTNASAGWIWCSCLFAWQMCLHSSKFSCVWASIKLGSSMVVLDLLQF